jgi:SAM-dependent methyltransferase
VVVVLVNSAVTSSHYPFDNAAPQAGDRLTGLATLYDPVTRRHLDRLGMTAGWRCLEVGAGAGSVARYMSERVGPDGHVIATDIDTTRMSGSCPANVELRRHDVGTDALPECAFDIVHTRGVLVFVLQRRSAVTRMIEALKPGAWLLIEELVAPPAIDAPESVSDSDVEVARKVRSAIVEVIRRHGGDPMFVWEIPNIMRDAGLTEIGAEGYFVPYRTDAVAQLALANIDQLGAEMIQAGLMNAAELTRFRAVLARPDRRYPASMALISVWGRRKLQE